MSLYRKVARRLYPAVEKVFRDFEETEFSRGSTLLDIPPRHLRSGGLGTTSYGEWCYTVGMFQAILGLNLPERPISMLDVGCGVGRLYLAAKPFLTSNDTFLGIDISEKSVSICLSLFRKPGVDFLHTPARNAYYSTSSAGRMPWKIEDDSKNLVTALSVWTHLGETDWIFFLSEVHRVLSPNGRAIVSFFVLDELYRPELKSSATSRYYPQPENKWIFDTPAYGSSDWFYPSWAAVPEVAIGVTKEAFLRALSDIGLRLASFHPGQWKDHPGLFFQDIAVLEKV